MKTKIVLMMAMLVMVSGGRLKATHYLFEDGDRFGSLILDNNDTLLMTGGIGEDLSLSGSSIATIENTSPLGSIPGDGGVWNISVSSTSILNIYGGEINRIKTYWSGIVNMTGGEVVEVDLYSHNLFNLSGGQVGQLTITSVESWAILDGYGFDYTPGNPLTGYWHDDTAFSIDLIDDGISTYGQIIFIPEPVSVLLLGIGGLVLRKRVNG